MSVGDIVGISGVVETTSSPSAALTMPAGQRAGDIAYVFVFTRTSVRIVVSATGGSGAYAQHVNHQNSAVGADNCEVHGMYRVTTADNETAPSVVYDIAPTGGSFAVLVVFRGFSTPNDGTLVQTSLTNAASPAVLTGMTTTTDDTLVVHSMDAAGNPGEITPADGEVIFDHVMTSPNTHRGYIITRAGPTPAGVTGNVTFTHSGGIDAAANVFALRRAV